MVVQTSCRNEMVRYDMWVTFPQYLNAELCISAAFKSVCNVVEQKGITFYCSFAWRHTVVRARCINWSGRYGNAVHYYILFNRIKVKIVWKLKSQFRFAGNLGGLCGVISGFSLISITEIVYFILKATILDTKMYIKRNKQWIACASMAIAMAQSTAFQYQFTSNIDKENNWKYGTVGKLCAWA